MNGSDSETRAEHRKERVGLETDSFLIKGMITLPAHGNRARFSEYLNRGGIDFIPLTDAERQPLDGRASSKHSFIAVDRSSVRFAYPLTEDESRMRLEESEDLHGVRP